jgi:glycosyltransferase involved in cell wall biosynthesis
MLQLQSLMESFRPHVVHTHTAKAGFVGRWAAHRAGVPVIVHTYHGHVLRGYFGTARSRFFTMLERKAAGWSRQIIALSESLRDELVQQYRIAPREKFTVMPLGLDLEPFLSVRHGSGEFRRELRIPPDAPLIGMVGRLAPVKNPAAFLSAAEIVRRSAPSAHFVMVGDGELRAALEAQARQLNLEESLHITGWKRDLRPVYADLDLLVLCSRNEGTPVALIEALAAGCPVVATPEGGIPEILEHGRWGRLTSADPPHLARSILDALEHPLDLEPVRQILRERHDPARHLRALDALYRRLLAEREIGS